MNILFELSQSKSKGKFYKAWKLENKLLYELLVFLLVLEEFILKFLLK